MIQTELEKVTQEVPVSMTCDRCGRVELIEKGTSMMTGEETRHWPCDFIVIHAQFGYSSKNHLGESMDGSRYEALICDQCFLPAMEAAGVKLHHKELF